MVSKRNTYFEAVLKQAGFDRFLAQKINEYRNIMHKNSPQLLSFMIT
jgi:hypothetical protein